MLGMFDLYWKQWECSQKEMFENEKSDEKSSKNLKKGVDFSDKG